MSIISLDMYTLILIAAIAIVVVLQASSQHQGFGLELKDFDN